MKLIGLLAYWVYKFLGLCVYWKDQGWIPYSHPSYFAICIMKMETINSPGFCYGKYL